MSLQKESFPVVGMSCAACAVSVESIVASIKGVDSASVNYANQQLQVEYEPQLTSPTLFKEAVLSIGYDLLINSVTAKDEQEEAQKKQLIAL